MNNHRMNRMEFMEWFKEEVKKRHPDWEVSEHEVQKMQGLSYRGILVSWNHSYGITLDPGQLYSLYLQKGAESCVEKMEEMSSREEYIAPYMDLNRIREYAYARTLLRVRLLPQKGNEQVLEKVPHRCLEDLAAVYYLETRGKEDTVLSLLVNQEIFGQFGIDEETLYRDAVENTARLYPARIEKIEYWMREEDLRSREGKPESPLWLGTSSDEHYGAAILLYPGFLKTVKEKVGGDFYILPSSVHEILFLKKEADVDPGMLQHMVEEINRTDVAPEDLLSNRIYFSDGDVLVTAARSYDA